MKATSVFLSLFLLLNVTASVFAGYDEWNILHDEAVTSYVKRKYDQALVAEKKALEIAEKKKTAMIPFSLMSLGLIHQAQGQYEEAEAAFRRALTIQENASGPDNLSLVNSTLGEIGKLYEVQGRNLEAETIYKRILANQEKMFGPNDFAVMDGLGNLIDLYFKTGRYEEAELLKARGDRISKMKR